MHYTFTVTAQNMRTGQRFPIYAKGAARTKRQLVTDGPRVEVDSGARKAIRAFNRRCTQSHGAFALVSKSFRQVEPKHS